MAFLFAGKVRFDKQRCGGAVGFRRWEAVARTVLTDRFHTLHNDCRNDILGYTAALSYLGFRPADACGIEVAGDLPFQNRQLTSIDVKFAPPQPPGTIRAAKSPL